MSGLCCFRLVNGYENDVMPITFLLFQVDVTIHEKYSSIVMIGRFFRALFYTFSGSGDTTLRKGPPGVFFSAVFSDSLNRKRHRVLPLSDSLKLNDIGFRHNDAYKHMLSPSSLLKITGVLARNGGENGPIIIVVSAVCRS